MHEDHPAVRETFSIGSHATLALKVAADIVLCALNDAMPIPVEAMTV